MARVRRNPLAAAAPWYVAVLMALVATPPVAAQLTGLGSVLLEQCTAVGSCETGDHFGHSAAAGDFDGDGFDDLAVGIPEERTNSASSAGEIEIFYGSPAGLSPTSGQLINQETVGVPGTSEAGDRFGWSLATGDLDGDGFDDLAVGVPFEDIGSAADAGMVVVLFGSAAGLSGSGALEWDQSNLTNPICGGESAETGDEFGFSVAIAASGNGSRTLVVGVPGEDGFFLGQADAGELVEIFEIRSALFLRGQNCVRLQDDPAFAACSGTGGVEGDDAFGFAVAERRHASSNPDPIGGAIGEETATGVANSGVVNTVDLCLQQNGPLLGVEENNDRFGGSLKTGDFNHDGREDLAIGVAGEGNETYPTTDSGGLAIVYANASDVLVTTGNQFFDEDNFFPDSSPQSSAHFGATLAAGDFDGDGRDDLAVGAPDHDLTGHANAGLFGVLYSAGSGGLSATNHQVFNRDSASIPGGIASGDGFGGSLAAGDFDGNGVSDLAVGAQGDNPQGVGDAGSATVLYGLERSTAAFGTVRFSTSAISVNESATAAVVVLVREGGAVLSASVDHSRTGGTATPGTDFSYSGGTSSWSVGDLSTNFFLVPIVHDTLDENNETLQIHLTNPSTGLAIGSPSTVTITIVDDDVAGSVQFASLQTHVSESAKTADITVTRSGGDASGVNVEYATSDGTATAGVDYQETHGTLSFSAGETSKTFSIKLFDDAVVEGDETVDLALIKVGGGGTFGTPSTSTLFILDDDGISNLIFADDFETGDSSRWSQTSP